MTLNRRMFLTGSGGAILAIPFLPSLMTRAFAAEPDFGPPSKCFFSVSTSHGDIWGKNMYPDDGLLTQTMPYAGRDVRFGALDATPDANGDVVWSPVCRAPAQVLTPALAAKFNILRGLDIPYRISHQIGGNLGNFAATVGNMINGLDTSAYMVPTIDQVMAYSPSFYTAADLSSRMTQNAFCVGWGSASYNYTAPAAKKGDIVGLPAYPQNSQLFDFLFEPGTAYHGVNQFIIDRVKGRYNALKADPRISVGDLQRLDQHVEMMFEVERKIQVSKALIEAGQLPAKPSFNSDLYLLHHSFPHDPSENALYCHLMNDIIVMAFNSGVSRVATWSQAAIHFTSHLINDWHGKIAHTGMGASNAQPYAVAYNQGTFEHILVDLASKLDAVSLPDGSTLLDNSLLMQTNEAGQVTHHSGCVNFPVITAGGAGGYFNTGKFVDFGNTNHTFGDLAGVVDQKPGLVPEHPGLYYNQFLANALMSMGVAENEWGTFTEFTSAGPSASNPTKGYGLHYVDAHRASHYAQAKLVMSDKLPVITNG